MSKSIGEMVGAYIPPMTISKEEAMQIASPENFGKAVASIGEDYDRSATPSRRTTLDDINEDLKRRIVEDEPLPSFIVPDISRIK